MSGASLPRRYQPQAGPAIRPLTPPVAPHVNPFYRASAESQARFHHPRVNAGGFPDPRRLPSASAPFPLARRVPATVPRALPPWAGFQRSFTPRYALATEELDPRRWAWAVHPGSRGPRAACRLLQSKRITSTTARPSKPRTPHRSRLLHSACCGWLEPVSRLASRDFTGQGPRWLPTHDLSPPRSLAKESFTPTR